MTKPDYLKYLPDIERRMKAVGLSTKVDRSGVAIGRKYARSDEIGVPFAVTVDGTTWDDNQVTLREIVSTDQVRVPIEEVANQVAMLCNNISTWAEVYGKYRALELLAEEKKKEW